MCRRSLYALAGAIALSALGGTRVTAQTSPPPLLSAQERAELATARAHAERRIQRLEARLEVLSAEAGARDAVRAETAANGVTELDTLFVGPFTLVARANQSADAERLARETLAPYAAALEGTPPFDRIFTYEIGPAKTGLGVTSDRSEIWQHDDAPDGARRDDIRSKMARMLSDASPSDLRDWMGRLQPMPQEAHDYRAAYRTMARTASISVAACLGGDRQACWASLDLTGDLDMTTIWYDAAQRERAPQQWVKRYASAAEECQNGVASACAEARGGLSRERAAPLDAGVRANLVWFALEQGGVGSWSRLVEASGSLRDRLAAAAGLSDADLMDAWMGALRGRRIPVQAELGRAALLTLLSLGSLGVVARRTTRWRFG